MGNSSISSTMSEDYDEELKNARETLIVCLSAAINFCLESGVPRASTGQLQRNLKQGRYYAVANRLQRYMQCIIDDHENDSKSESDTDGEPLTIKVVQLAVTVWESLCRDQALEHKRAYKRAHRLRRESSSGNGSDTSNNNILSSISSSMSISSSSSSDTKEKEVERAIEYQIKVAELYTACRKKLYLAKRWERQVTLVVRKRQLKEKKAREAQEPTRLLRGSLSR